MPAILGFAHTSGDSLMGAKGTDGWPAPKYARFDGEGSDFYQRRLSEIAEIQQGFRMGRYRGDIAEHMERRLIRLQDHPFVEARTA